MAADLDTSSHDDSKPDTTTISETSTSTTATDTTVADPDNANYASGNDPETAYRNQGRPDGPNSWASYTASNQDAGSATDGSAPAAPDQTGQPEAGHVSQQGELSGVHDPDAANYADLDYLTSKQDNNLQQQVPGSDRATASRPPGQAADAQSVRPDGVTAPGADSGSPSAPETEQLKELTADQGETGHELDEARQKIADLEAKNADLEAKNADLVAKSDTQAARIDDQDTRIEGQDTRLARIEQLLAGNGKSPDGTSTAPDQGAEKPDTPPDPTDLARAGRRGTDQGSDTNDAKRSWWRRAASADSLDIIQTLGGTGEAVAALAMNATPDGVVGLVLAGLGVAKIAMARYEKKRKGKT